MEQICQNAPKDFCLSLQQISCCDFFESENAIDADDFVDADDVVGSVDISYWNNYAYIRSNKYFRRYDNETIEDVINSEKNIQLLHDFSIQIKFLHISGLTFTDVDGNDILEVDGRFCIINTNKLVMFDKKTKYANLTRPISFGVFKANELSNIKRLPTINAIHKNSIIWSIGRIMAEYLFDEPTGEEPDKWYISLNKMNKTGIIPTLIRCLHSDPEQRMLLII
jgi:hypothetical protein